MAGSVPPFQMVSALESPVLEIAGRASFICWNCHRAGSWGGQQEGRASGQRPTVACMWWGAGPSPRTSEALMAFKGQKYPTGRGRGNGRPWCRCGALVSVCQDRHTATFNPCGSPFGLGFLGAELLFGSLYDKRMEKGKNKEKFIEIHSVGHTYTQTCTQTHRYTHAHTQIHTCIYTNTDIHIHTQTLICVYTHRYIHMHTHKHTYAYTQIHRYTQTHVETYTVRVCSVTQLCVTVAPWTIVARLLCPWDSSGKNTGMGCHFLLQGIFLTRGWNTSIHPYICI